MGLRSLGALAALALLGTLLLAVSSAGAAGETATKTYIVQMLQAPVLTYEGGVAGLPATKPAKGKKLDSRSAAVERYAGHLKRAHDEALAVVGGAEKLYDYVYSLNGVAAKLTAAQAGAVEKLPNVVAVTEDELYSVDTATTAEFLR